MPPRPRGSIHRALAYHGRPLCFNGSTEEGGVQLSSRISSQETHIGRVNLHPTAQRPTHADPRDVCFRAMVSLLPPHPFLMVDDRFYRTNVVPVFPLALERVSPRT